ncbi:hypothetical protein ENBRE01_2116 [Enteropsectra breve]|nr:hypothetical protein ENBRE01_2116 [Enteropsectra breve]
MSSSDFQKKLLKYTIVEIFLQAGFDRVAEQTLNILVDLMVRYISQAILQTKQLHTESPDAMLRQLFALNYSESEYENEEILNFLDQQSNSLLHLNVEVSETLPLTLNLLPKSIKFKSFSSSIYGMNVEEKNNSSSIEALKTDNYLEEFVSACKKLDGGYNPCDYTHETNDFYDKVVYSPKTSVTVECSNTFTNFWQEEQLLFGEDLKFKAENSNFI